MNTKVVRIVEKYDLDGLGDELVERWLGERGEERSLRDLADDFNRRVLRRAMEDAGMNLLDGDVENTYRLLTADDVSSGVRKEAERSLEREGIDVEELKRDFVSHQAIHTYLTKHRGVSKEKPSDRSQLEKGVGTVQQLKGRTQAVTQNIVDSLRETGRLDIGECEVIVDVQVIEAESGRTFDVVDLLEEHRTDEETA